MSKKLLPLSLTLFSCSFAAFSQDAITECVMRHYKQGDEQLTLKEIRQRCTQSLPKAIEVTAPQTTGAISRRIISERKTEFDPYVITPHNMNYILPALTTNAINKSAYQHESGYQENLKDIEAKFQLSLKVPLNNNSIFIEDDALYLGFTLEAWWQLYASGISKPFRETNYQPELFYMAPLDWHPFGGNTGFILGLEHQSNGRTQGLSRSWNRFYGHFLFEKGNFAFSLKPWVRLAEDKKTFPLDPDGDDNPDIDDYLGHFELAWAYKWHLYEISMRNRKNFATHHGFTELGFTFPLWGKLRGYATASHGYGESLIDYNYSQTRFGIGIALNNVL